MLTWFFETIHGPTHGNWGKFMVGMFDNRELLTPSHVSQLPTPLLIARGWDKGFVMVTDLETGEGALFYPGGLARADLEKHQIWVCPMYESFLEWLYAALRPHRPEAWPEVLTGLPRVVELPDAAFALQGYRRPGPRATRVDELREGLQQSQEH